MIETKKLWERIEFFRVERPSEWLMDDFMRDAKKLEARISDLERTNAELKSLVLRVSKKDCNCTMTQRSLGDGCEVCNPQLAIDMIDEA